MGYPIHIRHLHMKTHLVSAYNKIAYTRTHRFSHMILQSTRQSPYRQILKNQSPYKEYHPNQIRLPSFS